MHRRVLSWRTELSSTLGVRIRLAEQDYFRTKIVEVNPFWVLVNKTDMPLSLTQEAYGLDVMSGEGGDRMAAIVLALPRHTHTS